MRYQIWYHRWSICRFRFTRRFDIIADVVVDLDTLADLISSLYICRCRYTRRFNLYLFIVDGVFIEIDTLADLISSMIFSVAAISFQSNVYFGINNSTSGQTWKTTMIRRTAVRGTELSQHHGGPIEGPMKSLKYHITNYDIWGV